ncbi:MAG TPA: helix-turn-helix transcriptional regulator [Stellaceae bacterium]|nr:helix-turn-helix transcriptional regulator [Stellaceae bacterium]
MSSDLAKKIDQRVAHRIRERRLLLGMTQQHLAEMIGVAFQQAHKYERGLSRVSAGRLFHIATVLDTPITYFFSTGDEVDHDSGGERAIGGARRGTRI